MALAVLDRLKLAISQSLIGLDSENCFRGLWRFHISKGSAFLASNFTTPIYCDLNAIDSRQNVTYSENMSRFLAVIRRHRLLLVFLAIGLFASLSIASTSNVFFVLAEVNESYNDGENIDLDETLDLITRLCCKPEVHPEIYFRSVIDESFGLNTLLVSRLFERGPPLC